MYKKNLKLIRIKVGECTNECKREHLYASLVYNTHSSSASLNQFYLNYYFALQTSYADHWTCVVWVGNNRWSFESRNSIGHKRLVLAETERFAENCKWDCEASEDETCDLPQKHTTRRLHLGQYFICGFDANSDRKKLYPGLTIYVW